MWRLLLAALAVGLTGCDGCTAQAPPSKAVTLSNTWSTKGALIALGGGTARFPLHGELSLGGIGVQDERFTRTSTSELPPVWREALARRPPPSEPENAVYVGRMGDLWVWEETVAYRGSTPTARIIYTLRAARDISTGPIAYHLTVSPARAEPAFALDGVPADSTAQPAHRISFRDGDATWEIMPNMRVLARASASGNSSQELDLQLSPARSWHAGETFTFVVRFRRSEGAVAPLSRPALAAADDLYSRTASAAAAAHARFTAASKDPRAWTEARTQLRAQLLRDIGLDPLPERVPLQAESVKIGGGEGYAIEHVRFQSRPDFWVVADLCTPGQVSKPHALPAVLEINGHQGQGKDEESMRRRCITLARLGFVAMMTDTVGTGERNGHGFAHDWHYGGLLAGIPLSAFIVWDSMRSLDYLESRPEVDPRRMGMTGLSGGGRNTTITAALDERIAAAAPAGYLSGFAQLFGSGLGYCPCNYIPDLVRHADWGDVVGLIAPRPVIILSNDQDLEIPVHGAWRVYDDAQPLFETAGAGDKLHIATCPGGHAFERPMREALYGFMLRYLQNQGDGSPVPEPDFPLETLHNPPAKETLDVRAALARRAGELKGERAKKSGDLRALLRWDEAGELIGTLQRSAQDALRLQTRDGIALAASLREGEKKVRAILLRPDGAAGALETKAAQELRDAGAGVLALDLRGTGLTHLPRERAALYEGMATMRGPPLVTLRARELDAAIRWAQEEGLAAGPVLVVAESAELGLAALLAAAMGANIQALLAPELPRSLEDVLDSGAEPPPAALVAYRLLEQADIPELVERAHIPVSRDIRELKALLAR